MDAVVQAVLAEGERAVQQVRELARVVLAVGTDLREGAARTRRDGVAEWSSRAAAGYAEQRDEVVTTTVRAADGCDGVAAALRRHAVAAEHRLDELRVMAARVELAREEAAVAVRRSERLLAGVVREGAQTLAASGVRDAAGAVLGAPAAALEAARDAELAAGALGRRLREELPTWAVAG